MKRLRENEINGCVQFLEIKRKCAAQNSCTYTVQGTGIVDGTREQINARPGKVGLVGTRLPRPDAIALFVDGSNDPCVLVIASLSHRSPMRPLTQRHTLALLRTDISCLTWLRTMWFLGVLWCEVGVYRFVVFRCAWPDRRLSPVSKSNSQSLRS